MYPELPWIVSGLFPEVHNTRSANAMATWQIILRDLAKTCKTNVVTSNVAPPFMELFKIILVYPCRWFSTFAIVLLEVFLQPIFYNINESSS